MFETGKKSHSLFQLPSIQPHHSLEAARFLQKYLHRMRTVEMPDYSKIKSFVAKDSLTKLYHKSKSIKKPLKPEKELVIDSIDKYLELLSPFLLDKTSQHHRRLLHRVEEMIRNYPLMSEYLFESPESKKLVISPETLYSRLHDEHNPPLIHIIEKIEEFAKEEQDDELFSLGIRIKTLNRSLREALDVLLRQLSVPSPTPKLNKS